METLVLIVLSIVLVLLLITLFSISSSRRETKQDIEAGLKRTTSLMMEQMGASALENEQKLENIRYTMERRLEGLQKDYQRQMEAMRDTVDEKLQQTLESRITKSFQLVNDQLAQVSKGFGEMQVLTDQVGDLKRVLSNVKTRGVLGEYQLRGILEEILSPGQYEENVKTKVQSGGYVEFAVKLPGDDRGPVYLPIDSKFPGDAYSHLLDAQDLGDPGHVAMARKTLEIAVRKSAKDIADKYIDPPHTTDFAILFLPFEGLYAEVINLGLLEELQRQYKVNIAGPTTLAALLNSLQMGFKTLAIQKRSGEVWRTLEAVKTEFATFETVLMSMKKKLGQTNAELEKLMGPRTNQINRKLRQVSTMEGAESLKILDLNYSYQDQIQMIEEEEY